jgi:hypothetical protein
LIIYKGTFFNGGNADIDKSMVHKPLTILLPQDYEWRNVNIIDKSENINVSCSNTKEELNFEWDVLKENEYFTFDSVIEFKPKNNNKDEKDYSPENITRKLSQNIKFTQRITSLKSVDKETLLSKSFGFLEFFIISIYLLALIFGSLYWAVGQFVFPDYKILNEICIDSKSYFVTSKAKNMDEIKLFDVEGTKITPITISNSNNFVFTGKIKIVKNGINYWGLIIGGFLVIILLIVFLGFIGIFYHDAILYKKVKRIVDKYSDQDFLEKRRSKLLFPF